MKKYQIRQYLNIKRGYNQVFIGHMPPRALIIDSPPAYLKEVFLFLSKPKKMEEIKDFLTINLHLSKEDSELLVTDLIKNDIISDRYVPLDDRFSRHELYYDYVGSTEKDAQQILSGKKIGLIGVGGIGTNVAMILAGAGIGKLVLLDGDLIEESNLTRQFLYDEISVGSLKVATATKNLQELNSKIEILPIAEHLTESNWKDIFHKFFSDCDFVVLSADTPAQIHHWINNASIEHGFAYSNAGYIESMGIVGPLVIPGETACYECYKYIGDDYTEDTEKMNENLNCGYQTPSYGPLNSLVSSIQANEIIRYFLGIEVRTKGKRIIINSQNYENSEELFFKKPDCPVCSTSPVKEVI
jgi:molybdopterin/thiamine biosynthesis adenylyltransferase